MQCTDLADQSEALFTWPIDAGRDLRRPRPMDVLVVEDDPLALRAIELALGHLGYLVLSASSVKHARAILRTFAVDVVLCDVHLPDGTGSDLLPDVAACGHVAAVAMSGDAAALRSAAARGAFDGRVQKPIDFAMLDRLLRSTWRPR